MPTATKDPPATTTEEPEVTSTPGEQGTATQGPAVTPSNAPQIWDRAPSKEEVARARELHARIAAAADMGAEAVVDALIGIVDVHPDYKVPSTWPGKDDETLLESAFLKRVGTVLLKGCPKLNISPRRVVFLWRNKKTWTSGGVEVRTQAKKLSALSRYFSDGAFAVVIGNYRLFQYLNTRQKVAAIYHSLRELDAEGTIRRPQFSGFFDELELFGTGTFATDAHLVRAVERGSERELPWGAQPNLFDEPVDG